VPITQSPSFAHLRIVGLQQANVQYFPEGFGANPVSLHIPAHCGH
jgi:hypothetical protein